MATFIIDYDFVTGRFECFNPAWLLNTQLKTVTNSLLTVNPYFGFAFELDD